MTAHSEDLVRAFHEAGHAVAGWRLGAELRQVTIERGHNHHGIVCVHLPAQLVGPSSVVFQLCGGIAERTAFPHSDWRAHSEADLAHVAQIFARDPGHPERARLERMAARLVAEDWQRIEDVAHLLLARRTLDGAVLEATLDSTWA